MFDAICNASPWHRLYRETTLTAIDRTLSTLPPGPLRILDAGGGTGLMAEWLAKKGHHVVLVDTLPDMLEISRKKSRETPFEVRQGDLSDLSWLDPESFDAIVCTQVLNFFPDLGAVFQQFAGVLKPSGMVFADIDNPLRWCLIEALDGQIENAIAIVRSGKDERRNIVGADYFFHRKQDLAEIVASAGLRLEASWGVAYIAPYVHIFARSQEFLTPEKLPERAAFFAREENYEKLRALEAELAALDLCDEMAGYLQFFCVKH